MSDERYFDIVEIFFLFAGHTHSPIDQNFSVVSHAINRSNFIGSTVAMNELLKVAHDVTDQKIKIKGLQKLSTWIFITTMSATMKKF